jgi:hypothetical protein
MFNNIEESIRSSIHENLMKEADAIVDNKLIQIRKDLWDAAQKEINDIMNAILVTSVNDIATLKTEIHVSLSGTLKK